MTLRRFALEHARDDASRARRAEGGGDAHPKTPSTTSFEIAAILVTLAALFSYVNHRFVRLPMAIGTMLIALLASLLLMALHELRWRLDDRAAEMLATIDFNRMVLGGMLAFLLFAGALHVELDDLPARRERSPCWRRSGSWSRR